MNLQVDRLSNLPDDLIHKILSLTDIKDAIKTIALSSRYRSLWTSLPYLSFSNYNSSMLTHFSKFVTHVLCRRDTQIEVYSVKLSFRGKVCHVSAKSILDYAFSHNVQEMTVTYSDDRNNRHDIDLSLSLFSSQSLKHLSVSGAEYRFGIGRYINPTSTWELPALTTLHLYSIRFNGGFTDLFSKCSNLKNLSLSYCKINCDIMRELIDVEICHPGLSNLTLEYGLDFYYVINVVTPQLKNLTIRDWSVVHLTSAPKLDSLVFKGNDILQYSPNVLCSLEKADLCFHGNYYRQLDETYAHEVVDLLQQIRCVKYLTINTEFIQLLSSFKELISPRPSPFANLKILKIYPHNAMSNMEETMPIEVKNYLLDSSSGVTFTMVSCKEIIALRNALSAQHLMAALWVNLEEEKAKCETTSAVESHDIKMHEKREAQVQNEKARPMEKKKLDIEGRMEKISTCLEDLSLQFHEGMVRTRSIVYMLCEIEELLLEDLPTSKRDKLQARFSILQEEAETVIKKIIDRMKIQCDEKQSHVSVRIHELAKTYQPCS